MCSTRSKALKLVIAFFLTLLLGSIFTRLLAETIPRGQIERKDDITSSLLLTQNNSLLPISYYFNGRIEFIEIYDKYPQLAETLICLWWEESRYGTDMIGDGGLAIGHFQIHIDKHPEVSYECSMDFSCSLKFTAESIMKGNQNWWSPIKDGRCNIPL